MGVHVRCGNGGSVPDGLGESMTSEVRIIEIQKFDMTRDFELGSFAYLRSVVISEFRIENVVFAVYFEKGFFAYGTPGNPGLLEEDKIAFRGDATEGE